MQHLQAGQRAPEVSFRLREHEQWVERNSQQIFAGRTVVLFALPGAFTPTCSSAHLPRYEELVDALALHGVDEVLCLSVNDGFVMEAWAKAHDVSKVSMLADGNAEFTRQMGMLVDKSELGFGPRSRRYSMIVTDSVIEKIFVEPEVEGDPYGVSDAETMLRHFDAEAQLPPDILLFTKLGCAHCARARRALDEIGLAFDELAVQARQLRALSSDATTPRVFINGELVGGADELATWLART